MPESTTLVHFTQGNLTPACKMYDENPVTSPEPGDITCFACRRTLQFKAAQRGIGDPTPLPQRNMPTRLRDIIADPQRDMPKLLRDIIAEAPEIKALTEDVLKACRNERGMYVIEEFIHHGEYRSRRRVEVYAINAVTVDAVLQSSAYCYGSWLHPDNPDHKQPRNTHLHQLVEDLRTLRTNRAIGWSTFRIITPEEN